MPFITNKNILNITLGNFPGYDSINSDDLLDADYWYEQWLKEHSVPSAPEQAPREYTQNQA
jgi:hypothetical protein